MRGENQLYFYCCLKKVKLNLLRNNNSYYFVYKNWFSVNRSVISLNKFTFFLDYSFGISLKQKQAAQINATLL